ncbi:hypothetical protein ACQB60_16245 [Actinomycetota bacterium Odt1-20B]
MPRPTNHPALRGLDPLVGRWHMYAVPGGVSRVYGLSFTEGQLRIWCAASGFHQRFAARFDASGDTLSGAWELSKDGVSWAEDFGVVYERAPA